VSVLQVESLSGGYGTFLALQKVSLEVATGETHALIGANGAGKTTLLRTIAGGLAPSAGRISFKGEEVQGKSEVEMVRRGVALVPEGRQLFPELSVHDNLMIGADAGRRGRWSLPGIYRLFPDLELSAGRPAGLLSGGQQQMVAIGRALLMNPDLLMVDEASLGLAPVVVDKVYTALRALTSEISILIIEQDVHRAIGFADRFSCMLSGRITLTGSCEQTDLHTISNAYFGTTA